MVQRSVLKVFFGNLIGNQILTVRGEKAILDWLAFLSTHTFASLMNWELCFHSMYWKGGRVWNDFLSWYFLSSP